MPRGDSPEGFTLIEVMIGMVILTVIALGLTSVTLATIRGNRFSNRLTLATTLSQDRLEYVKRLGYSQANSAVGTEDYGSIANFAGFKRVTAVANDTPATNIKTVTVTVSWQADAHAVAATATLAE